MYGYIYLIHLREFIRLNEHVYKIGRCFNESQRLRDYPKGSRLLLSIYLPDHVKCETELIRQFIKKYQRRQEYGSEYFTGDVKDMIRTITSYSLEVIESDNIPELQEIVKKKVVKVKKEKPVKVKKENAKPVKPKKVVKDRGLAIEEYVYEHKEDYDNKRVSLNVFEESFRRWLEMKEYKVGYTRSTLLRSLKSIYKVKMKVDEETAITFPANGQESDESVISFPQLSPIEQCHPFTHWLRANYNMTNCLSDRIKVDNIYNAYNPKPQGFNKKKQGHLMRLLGYKSKGSNGIRYYKGLKVKESESMIQEIDSLEGQIG